MQRLADVEAASDGLGGTFSSFAEAKKAEQRWFKLRRYALQAAAMRCLPSSHRLHKCLRAPLGSEVGIVHSPIDGSAHFRNVATCGSVWACPVCAAKVSERRREELAKGLKKWRGDFGGAVWLVTLTFSHQKHESLPMLLKGLSKAMKLFQGGSAAKKDRERFGIWGQVRALEVTHGRNGWHPHIHMLVFLEAEDSHANRERFRQTLFERWRRACDRAGLGTPTEKYGVKVDGYHRAGEYVTKWGVEHELTKQVTKEGRTAESRTPLGILGDFLDTGDCEDAALFGQFAAAFKGQRQLVWSRNMRAILGLGAEPTDEEVAAADERQAGDVDLVSMPMKVWGLVVKHEVRGQLLALAGLGDAEAVKRFLRALPGAEGLEVANDIAPGGTPRRLLEMWCEDVSAD
ncbi:Replication protein [compost metagenome]